MFEFLRFKIRIAKAFTLAEVLITLTIIGAIAALTIPALITNIQDATLKAAFKKEFSVVNAAYTSLVQDNGGSLKGVYNDAGQFANAFKDKFNYVKYCTVGSASNCIPDVSQYKYLDDTNGTHPSGCFTNLIRYPYPANVATYAAIVLPDGAVIMILGWYKDCDVTDSYINNACASIVNSINIDVNGNKGPNVMGKDLFIIMPYESTIKPAGISTNLSSYTGSYNWCTTRSCSTSSSGFGCAAQVLEQ